MQVAVLPAHRELNDDMEIPQRGLSGHQHATVYLYMSTVKGDEQLVEQHFLGL